MVIGLRGEVLKPLAHRWTAKAISFGFPAHKATTGPADRWHTFTRSPQAEWCGQPTGERAHKLEVSLADARSRASHGDCAMTRPPEEAPYQTRRIQLMPPVTQLLATLELSVFP